jgi:two-component system response regulator AtoC
MMNRRILVVDNSESTCLQVSQWLARPDRRIKVAHDATVALEWLVEGSFSLVLTDLRLPGIDGLDLIREIRQRDLPVTVVVMTGHASIDTVVEAMKLGAYDYLLKPIDPIRLEILVEQALRDRTLRDEVAALREGNHRELPFHQLLGRGPGMREVFARVTRASASDCTVLISGETGTGKDLVAQALHDLDPKRSSSPFVAVHCAALPESLLTSELFGHERGAFTGADQRKPGRFELARGGTLFLDEIGGMPLAMQAKLLRVLQDNRFERVGGSETLAFDARIVVATQIDLEAAVAAGRFREDLFYRLNVLRIAVPPLRERTEDVPLLVEHFLNRLREKRYPSKAFSLETLARLERHQWPGNVRELEHLVEQLVVTTSGSIIEPKDLPPHVVSTLDETFRLDFDISRHIQEITDELVENVERRYLNQILQQYQGRIDRCSEHCGLSRRSISQKLSRYGIDKSEFKPDLIRKRELAAQSRE